MRTLATRSLTFNFLLIVFIALIITSSTTSGINIEVQNVSEPGTTPFSSKHPDFEYQIIDERNEGRVALGDIDGDGKNDIAVHAYDKNIVWYKYPNWAKTVIVSNDDIRGDEIVLIDLDQDGDLDVVSPFDNQGRNLWWFENPLPKGDPGSAKWMGHKIGEGHVILKNLDVVDFDHDGKLDVAARHRDRIYLYFQNTPEDWVQRILYTREREGMDVGDIDHDGDMDIVLNGFWLENPSDPYNDTWSEYSIDDLWFNQDEGDWRDNAAKVYLSDINQDGRLDVVFSHSEKEGYPVAWYETTNPKAGDSAWTKHVIGYVDNCHTLQVADMDKDGDLDVVAGRLRDDPFLPLYIFYNEGGGNTWEQVQIFEGGSYSGKVGDIDNDGDLDFISSRTWVNSPIYILRNLDNKLPIGPWERHVIDTEKPWRSVLIMSGDINFDGLPDIITGAWWYKNPGDPSGIWTRNNIGSPLKNMAAVFDFDFDGDLDILGTEGQGSNSNDSFVWASNNGEGSFRILDNIQDGDGDFLQGVAVVRSKIERHLEVALSWHQSGKGVQVLRVPADPLNGTWTWQKIHNSSQDEQLSTGDIDRDGDIDLLQGTRWLRNDDGTWTQFTLNDAGGSPDRNRLADINGDGRLDAVIGFEAISTPGKLAWYQQPPLSSNETWTEHVISKKIIGPMSLDVADIDSDGDLDVVVGEHNLDNPSNAKLFVYENADGIGSNWYKHVVYIGDEHHDGTQLVDIDNDGDLDIISIGWGHNRVVLYENKAHTSKNPISWLKLDETDGTIAEDTMGSHNGKLVNGPEWRPAEGKLSGGLSFDGVDDFVDLGAMDVRGDTGLTIALWFKADDFEIHDARFISKATGVKEQEHYWMLSTFNETALRFRLKTDGITHVLLTETGQIKKDIWYHLAATYDGNKMRIYKNAEEIMSKDISGIVNSNASVSAALGNQPVGAGSRPFDGFIDDVYIYDRALSSAEIIKLMNGALHSIVVDDYFVSDSRCDVKSEQIIGFHGIYSFDGTNVNEGIIYINGNGYPVNSSGWISFNYSLSDVGVETFEITGVNISNYTIYKKFIPNVTIIWDRVRIIEGGVHARGGKDSTIWFKAEYEYDSTPFNSSYGSLYVNGSVCTWSESNFRWEIERDRFSTEGRRYVVSGILDNAYNLTMINIENGYVFLRGGLSLKYIAGVIFIIFIISAGVLALIMRVRKRQEPLL